MKTTIDPNQLLPIYITHRDKTQLENMLESFRKEKDLTGELSSFAAELQRAVAVEPHQIPPDVVRMNSRVSLLDLDSSEEISFTLVFPWDADPGEEKLSILAPLAAAALGYDCGDEIEWDVPAGTRRFRIVEVSHSSDEI